MNVHRLRQKFRIIDPIGLTPETVLNMRLLILAVMGGMVWGNITNGIAFTGYWKELGVSDTLYGVLLALPAIANAFQFVGSYYMERTQKRARLFIVSGMIQRVVWIPFALVPFIVPMAFAQLRIWLAAMLVFASAAMMPFMNVAFFSICDDVVPLKTRGRYFAARSRIATLTGLVVGLLVGMLLDAMPGMPGYSAAFLIAGVMGTLDIVCFLYMKLPPMRPAQRRKPMLQMMRAVVADKKYMRVVTLSTLWLFTVMLCAPYFNVYMQGVMKMTNLQITLYAQIASNIALIFVVTRWGRALDRFGSKPILMVGCFFSAIMPLFWLIIGAGDHLPVILTNMLTGATWCAYDLGAQNLFMGQADGENKSMYFAVYFMFTQLVGSAFGSFAGGWLLDNVLFRLEPLGVVLFGWQLTRYNYLFAISSLLRLAVLFIFLPRVIEEDAGTIRDLIKSAWSGVSGACARRRHFGRARRGNPLL
ncbi:MAG: MFS transporter [Christensenellales bacterium]|jgi:MFS family permease